MLLLKSSASGVCFIQPSDKMIKVSIWNKQYKKRQSFYQKNPHRMSLFNSLCSNVELIKTCLKKLRIRQLSLQSEGL